MRVSGEIHYTALFGSHLVLRRSYRLFCGGDEVELVDELENREFVEDRYMLLYHCNLGYPFLTEQARVELPAGRKTEYVNERARERAAFAEEIEKPTPKCPEEVFCHTLPAGDCQVEVRGERQTFTLSFSADRLPYLTQWKSMSAGDYVLGVEPCTTKLFDRRPTAIGAGATHRFALRFAMRGNAEE